MKWRKEDISQENGNILMRVVIKSADAGEQRLNSIKCICPTPFM